MTSNIEIIVINEKSMIVKCSRLKENFAKLTSVKQSRYTRFNDEKWLVSKHLRLPSKTDKSKFDQTIRIILKEDVKKNEYCIFNSFFVIEYEGSVIDPKQITLKGKGWTSFADFKHPEFTSHQLHWHMAPFKNVTTPLYFEVTFNSDINLTNYCGDLIVKPTFGTNNMDTEASTSSLGLDFTFIVEDKPILASKRRLANASPVFEAMFESNWKDSRENRVDIEECSYEAMGTFVDCLHGMQVEISSVVQAVQIMAIADKYQVNGFSEPAEDYLIAFIDKTNVVDILALSATLGQTKIITYCLAYITSRFHRTLDEIDNIEHLPPNYWIQIAKKQHTSFCDSTKNNRSFSHLDFDFPIVFTHI